MPDNVLSPLKIISLETHNNPELDCFPYLEPFLKMSKQRFKRMKSWAPRPGFLIPKDVVFTSDGLQQSTTNRRLRMVLGKAQSRMRGGECPPLLCTGSADLL